MPQMTTVPYENKKISASPVPVVSHLLPLRFVAGGGSAAPTVSAAAVSSGTPSRSPVAGGEPVCAVSSGVVSTAVAAVVSPSDPELRHLTPRLPVPAPPAPRPPTAGALVAFGAGGAGAGDDDDRSRGPYEYVVYMTSSIWRGLVWYAVRRAWKNFMRSPKRYDLWGSSE